MKKSRKRQKIELNLKKQTQFKEGQIGAKSYMKGDYEDFYALGRRENKANSKPIRQERIAGQVWLVPLGPLVLIRGSFEKTNPICRRAK